MAEVTWNGASKTYRVQGSVFRKGRSQIVTDADLIAYLKMQRGFTVVEAAKQAAEAAQEAPQSAATPPADEPDAIFESRAGEPARVPKKRYLKD